MNDPDRGSAVQSVVSQMDPQEALRLTQYCVDHASVGIMRVGPDARILSVNNEICQLLGYTREELSSLGIADIDPNFTLEYWPINRRGLATRGHGAAESSYRRKDGALVPVEIITTYLQYEGSSFAILFVHDITDRKRVEDARVQLEQQLLQLQRMESIGRLASGVAHDFNNLITVIQGYCDLIEDAAAQGTPLRDEVGQIRLASQRAASLTRQLLTFSRRQALSPSVLTLNSLLAQMQPLLERLIGADILLRIALEPELHPVIADAAQLEQLIVNLVINARDAMPAGGVLVIETSNVERDTSAAGGRPDVPVGPCVLLTVTDTGVGMDEATQAQIFEPFFTTKDPGKGTGLGLALVYGIVKQSGGDIAVSSQPGRGSTFRILLPASTGIASAPAAAPAPAAAAGGSETVLLVEDDALVRDLVRTVLHKQGYTVLEAAHGREAIAVAQQHAGSIDLLVTDVAIPQMSGRDLAGQLSQLYQQLKVLFLSGHADDAAVRYGLLTAGGELLAKPFSPVKLAGKVREVLDKARGFKPTQAYYDQANDALAQTLDISNSAANTRSFGQVMLAQGNVLAIRGDLVAATEHLMRGRAIFRSLGDQSNQALLQERLGWVAREQGDASKALAWLEEAIALNRKLGDRQQLAWAMLTMSGVAVLQEDAAGAEALIAQAKALQPESHDWTGWSLDHLGHAAQLRKEYGRAEQLHRESLELFVERLGDKGIGVMWAYQGLGEVAIGQGDGAGARKWLRMGLRLSSEQGTRILLAWCLAGLGGAAALSEDAEQAARLWGAAAQLRAALGCRPAPATRASYERLLARARAQLGEVAFAAAWDAGAALSLRAATDEALGDEG
jgi:two-component system cell cycle sensor histidine kinase/response regulator CckA